MATKFKIRKGDEVIVLTGRDKGKKGRVLQVIRKDKRALVEGVNIIKRHTRPSQNDPDGGIISFEAPIHISNVMLVESGADTASRVRMQVEADGTKERISVKSGNPIPRPQ